MAHLTSFASLIKLIKAAIDNEDSEPDTELITQKFKNVVEMLVDAEKTQRQEVYDLFCELEVMDLLERMMKYDKEVVIRTLSLILINLKNELWIGHIMADKLVVELIDSRIDEENQELIEHYISFLKSLSIRLDTNNLSLFYNKKYSVFPLLSKGLTFYNHPDNMVRTSVMNLTLGIMKIKDPRLTKYFSALPFTLYIIHFCHSLNHQWRELHSIIHDSKLTKHRLKMEISDQNDSMYYLYDLFQHGSHHVRNNIKNTFFSTCVLPLLIHQILKEEVSPKLCLYLIHSVLKVFKDKDICELLAILLFGKRINSEIIKKIYHVPHTPLSWREVHDSKEKSFFDSFEYEVTDNCEQIFKDIANFDTQHEQKKLIGDISPNSSEFYEEAKRISESVGFDILSIEETKPFELLEKCKQFQNSEDNPIRAKILELFRSGDDSMVWIITNIIIGVQKKQEISNDALKYCGLLMPKMDTVNYLDDFNINSMVEIKDILLHHLKQQTNYRIVTTKNIVHLLSELIFKEVSKQQLSTILDSYQQAITLLKSDLKVENLEHVALSFFDEFKRWSNHAFLPEVFIPFSVFSSPKESFPEIKNQEHLPTNDRENVTRNIQLFALNRILVTTYRVEFMKVDRQSLPAFEQGYVLKFNHTSTKWKVGKSYAIQNRSIMECKEVFADKRKAINLLLVQDPYNFVLVDPSADNYSGNIYFNIRFKHMTFELMKAEPKNILITWACETSGQKMLGFNNDLQAMEMYQRIKKRVRESYEEKQGYILKFIQSCQKDLKGLRASQN